MKQDMNRVLVEGLVRRTLPRLQESPERAIRNLVDMGVHFSNGRFQTRLLKTAQEMLRNPKSAYYTWIKQLAGSVDPDILTTFSVNLGYNGCTRGAERIRAIEAENGFNIPWSLQLAVNFEKLEQDPDFYPGVLRQGVDLGIHTYLLYAPHSPERLIPLMQSRPECAFLLFVQDGQCTGDFVTGMQAVKHAMTVVHADEDMPEACKQLREARLLSAVYQTYTDSDVPNLLNSEWLAGLLDEKPAFVLLQAASSCSEEAQRKVYRYVTSIRNGQRYPVFLIDIKQDMLLIDQVISDDVCLAGFDFDGTLKTQEGRREEERCNLFTHRLRDILQVAVKKK